MFRQLGKKLLTSLNKSTQGALRANIHRIINLQPLLVGVGQGRGGVSPGHLSLFSEKKDDEEKMQKQKLSERRDVVVGSGKGSTSQQGENQEKKADEVRKDEKVELKTEESKDEKSEATENQTSSVQTIYTEEYIKEVYMYMYPEDKSLSEIFDYRATIVAEFLVEIEGKIPFMITNFTRLNLMRKGVKSEDIDHMKPLQASALSYRLDHDTLNPYSPN